MSAASTSGGPNIPGYDFGAAQSAKSPVSIEELRQLEQTVGWKDGDAQLLKKYAAHFEAQAEKMVDAWRAVIGAQPQLAQWFFGPDGKPDEEYKAAVKRRFVQWVMDVATRPHDPRGWITRKKSACGTPRKRKTRLTGGARRRWCHCDIYWDSCRWCCRSGDFLRAS